MANDPLSISATVLPGSTFDPVQFAANRRQEVLNAEKEKRSRMESILANIEEPGATNPWRDTLINEYNDLLETGIDYYSQGYDISDILSARNRDAARDFNTKRAELGTKVQKANAIEALINEATKTLTSDTRNVFNVGASAENINKILKSSNIEEAESILRELGDNVLVQNPNLINIAETISKQLPNYISPSKYTTITEKDGEKITTSVDSISAADMKSALTKMYNSDPNIQETIRYERYSDPLDNPNDSDLDYMFKKYGNEKLRQNLSVRREPVTPGKEEDVKMGGSITTNIVFDPQQGIAKEVTGRNVINVPEKAIEVSNLKDALDTETNTLIPASATIQSFTPMHVFELPVTAKDTKGMFVPSIFGGGGVKAGTVITDDQIKTYGANAIYKKFVEGYIQDEEGRKTRVLVPYESIGTKLESKVKGLSEAIKKPKETEGVIDLGF